MATVTDMSLETPKENSIGSIKKHKYVKKTSTIFFFASIIKSASALGQQQENPDVKPSCIQLWEPNNKDIQRFH